METPHLEKIIFKTERMKNNGSNSKEETLKYEFVQVKISRTRSKVKLIQIIDISERVLNNMMKSEKVLLTLINATVSHELRNPLNSLIG